jgi:uncharacterized protein YjlB
MTAATLHLDMRAAFRSKLLAFPDLPMVAWEGKVFNDELGKPFIREQFRAITSNVRALGPGGTIAHRMTGNLLLFFPAGNGTVEIDTMAGLLLDHFAPGQSLAYGSSAGTIMNTERAALLQEPNWLSCPITISITAYTAN